MPAVFVQISMNINRDASTVRGCQCLGCAICGRVERKHPKPDGGCRWCHEETLKGLQQGGVTNLGFFLVDMKTIGSSFPSPNLKTQGHT